ncbi:MAG: SHOCT domain-containing protein [Ruminococcaceae bacterium]|nr:SHOCT domain-containing protein [Oscillospiraceae bacterium]
MMGAINIFSLLFILLYVVVAIFSGLTFKNSPKKVVATGKQAVTSPSSVASASDNLDNLLRLKKLLDDEIITQEEFEAKKKEMLNL